MYPYKFIFSNETPEFNQSDTEKVLCGIVSDKENNPIKDAIVRIDSCHNDCSSIYILTDKDGDFIYGPIKSAENINIKVWVEDIQAKKYVINKSSNA